MTDYPDFGQKLTSEGLIEKFPETRLVADPVPVTFRQVGSTAIGPADWVELRDTIHRIACEDPGIAGFVIPHGTATLEETAFFLNLTLGTGQRTRHRCRDEPGQRAARRGLRRFARHGSAGRAQRRNPPGARCRQNLDLSGPDLPLARLRRARPCRWRRATFLPRALKGAHARHAVRRARDQGIAARRCDLLLCRDQRRSRRGGREGGAQGLVSAGFAPGTPSPAQQAAFLQAVRSEIVVVQCSRATGRIAPRRRLRETGIVAGEDLTPQKARILLALMLTTTRDAAEIQKAFQSY